MIQNPSFVYMKCTFAIQCLPNIQLYISYKQKPAQIYMLVYIFKFATMVKFKICHKIYVATETQPHSSTLHDQYVGNQNDLDYYSYKFSVMGNYVSVPNCTYIDVNQRLVLLGAVTYTVGIYVFVHRKSFRIKLTILQLATYRPRNK